MPRHLINDAQEWINEIPSVPIYIPQGGLDVVTLGNDQAVFTASSFKIMVPLTGDKVACPVYEKREVHLFFMTLADLVKHLSFHHVEAEIKWTCNNCQRCFTRLHGARCHLPKCSSTNANGEAPYECEACPMSFGTQRGLSTHKRHAVRNWREKFEKKGSGPP